MEDLLEGRTILERMWKRGMIRRARKIARNGREMEQNARSEYNAAWRGGRTSLTNDAPLLLNARAYETTRPRCINSCQVHHFL